MDSLPQEKPTFRFTSEDYAAILLPAAPYSVSFIPDRAIIGFSLDPQQGHGAYGGELRRSFSTDPFRLAFTPAGCDVYSESRHGGEYLVLSVSSTALELAADGEAEKLNQFSNISAPQVTPLALSIRKWLLSTSYRSAMNFDTLAATIVTEVVLRNERRSQRSRAAASMTPLRLRKIFDFIDAHLQTGFRISDLAKEVGLSEGYLARSFQAATGSTLHGATIERRLARAKVMILSAGRHCDATTALARVAAESGFCSHAHMTTTFRRVMGVSPSDWRRAMLS